MVNVTFPITLKFPVQSFRRIPNPYAKSDNGDNEANMYMAICDVKLLPSDIPMDTNPREQNLNTNVAKKIKNSLLDTSALDFYLLNRGMLLSAQKVQFNNYSNELTVVFSDPDVHGDVDGGHTYRTILENRDLLDPEQQYVKIEILTGIEDIFQSLAAARNTSVQVQDKSIAELENRFDIIKNALKEQPYMDRVYFKENDSGEIDVADILSILMMFNIDRFPDRETLPTISYSSKKKCIDLYIQDHKKEYEKTGKNPYVKMQDIMPDIFKLYDAIERNMGTFYRTKNKRNVNIKVKGDLGLQTRGWGNVSVENNHIDVFIFGFADVLTWLSKRFDEPRFSSMANVISTSMRQLLPFEGHLCGVAKPGYYPEVIQHTNWDYGRNGKGFYNDIFAPGWTVASLWELYSPGRAERFFHK